MVVIVHYLQSGGLSVYVSCWEFGGRSTSVSVLLIMFTVNKCWDCFLPLVFVSSVRVSD